MNKEILKAKLKAKAKNKFEWHESLSTLVRIAKTQDTLRDSVTMQANAMGSMICHHIDKLYKKIDEIDTYLKVREEEEELKTKETKATKKRKKGVNDE